MNDAGSLPRPPADPDQPAFLAGGGELGARMRAHDWSASPLGWPDTWPGPLRTVVGIMLAANQPMFAAWGPDRAMLYNDPYAEILGTKHPAALGRPFFEVWHELKESVGPIMDRAYAGEPTVMDDIALTMLRHGYEEETHFTFFYAPLRDEEGAVRGVYCACTETTAKVFAERRAAFRSSLDERLRDLADPAEVMAAAADALGSHLGVARVGYAEVDGGWATVEREWNPAGLPTLVGRHRLDDYGPARIADMRAGRNDVIADFAADPRLAPSDVAIHHRLGIRAQVVVPLVKAGALVALLFVHAAVPRRWHPEEVAVVADAAERTWAAVERARAEAERRESEGRFLALVNATANVVYRMGPDWREMRRLDGAGFIADTEAPTTDWVETYIPPEERPRVREAIERAIRAKSPFELEHRVLRVDGTIGWTHSRAIPILDADGEIVEWFGAASDVTARVMADQSFKRVFAASPTPFLALAPDPPRFTITEVNDAYLAATMRTREDLVGRGIFEAFPDNPEDPAATGVSNLRASLERALASRRPDFMPAQKYDIARPDGGFEERWWDPVNSPVLDTDGAVEAIIHHVTDVTEQRRISEAIRANEARHRKTLEIETVGVVYFDMVGGITDANDAFLRLIGYSREELEAGEVRYENLTPPDWTWRDEQTIKELLTTGHGGPSEKEYFRRDGSRMWILCASKMLDERTAVEFVIDVTERKAGEAALRRSEAAARFRVELGDALRKLTSPSEIMAAVAERLGPHLGVDQANYYLVEGEHFVVAEEWRTANSPGLLGRHLLAAFGEGTVASMHAAQVLRLDDTRGAEGAEAFAAAGMAAVLSVPLRRAGRWAGGLHVHAARPRAWTDEEERLLRETAERAWAEIERARAEAALRESEARLRELNAELEARVAERTAERDRVWMNSRDLLLVLDTRGVFRAVNPAWTAILGYEPHELIGRNVVDLVLSDDAGTTAGALDEAAAARDLTNFENRYAHKDGSVRWISWRTATQGDLIFAYGRDITVEKARQAELEGTQEALRQAQKMEAVGQLTGGIAHDFNNMLQGVAGGLDLARRRIDEGRAGDATRYLETAREAAGRAATLTRRLLAFARRQPLDARPVDLDALVGGMAELVRRTVGPQVEVELRLADGCWPVLCDANQMESALLNLAINARDAMPGGGRLVIATGDVRLGPADLTGHPDVRPGDFVEVAVSDTGAGMPPDVLARAFEPFFTTKPTGRGTGLGLSQVYGLVRQTGGFVRLESEAGQGTRVRLFLPRHDGPTAAAEPAPAADGMRAPALATGTVLLVEDEASVRDQAADALREAGLTVLTAGDGTGALALLRGGAAPDVLVTDVGLPGVLNGRQVGEAAREMRPGLPVLFITGYAGGVLGDALPEGMSVIGKPFTLDALILGVRRVLAHRTVPAMEGKGAEGDMAPPAQEPRHG